MNHHQELVIIALACLFAAVLIYFFPSGPRATPLKLSQTDYACAHYTAVGQSYKCRAA
jgi:hypothetical protein